MDKDAELILISYFGRYEVVDEIQESKENDN